MTAMVWISPIEMGLIRGKKRAKAAAEKAADAFSCFLHGSPTTATRNLVGSFPTRLPYYPKSCKILSCYHNYDKLQ